ncbi:hypothetical protein TGAM01_v204027 [Trichoderma gamsii]|uniref:Uncharacterized protein n=1 Tax=Trichoderma gamsii TaxID=398673 RepID=A0A2P4ZRZ9_9HYPO|nr:hypothetical protein TGAM01_v204027 [Trichoderma gamsii]PON27079.1 hypothetical protein TGAM01_v204027 [Trichoderma gamsii]
MTLYPGLGLPLRHYPLEYDPREDHKFYPLGQHAHCCDSHSALLPVREVAMMNIMEQLTDKENWHNLVFNDEIVNEWRKEALEKPNRVYWKEATDKGPDARDWEVRRPRGIVDAATFDYCVKELRNKASYYVETGIIPTLDASAAIAKSDVLVAVSLRAELQEAFNKLKLDQRSKPNWHPRSNEQVLDLVHPSMYPLVYGRTRVLQDEVVGVTDAIHRWAGKGEPIAKDISNPSRDRWGMASLDSYWSNTYQWLPANVEFMEDGTVKFASYINNLHPQKYPQIYRTIEKLIEAALPTWDQCLSLRLKDGKKNGAGRTGSRFPLQDINDEVAGIWDPSSPQPLDEVDEDDGEDDGRASEDDDEDEDDVEFAEEEEDPAIVEWKETRNPIHPRVPEFEDIEYAQRETARLAHKFKKTGLQVIVKMTSIELTPEKPEFPAGEWDITKEWHVDGQMNEHICATALYCVDSENVAPSSILFCMQTEQGLGGVYESVTNFTCSWLERTHGTSLEDGGTRRQMYGAVQMQEGRLLAFPNVFQHKESSIKLKDPSKPGTRHLISLRLVDPSMRIISTANVPPQQRDWWLGAVLRQPLQSDGSTLANLPPDLVAILEQKNMSGGELPVEILDMVRAHLHNDESFLPMTEEEARKHRAELLQERIEHHTRAWLSWADSAYVL